MIFGHFRLFCKTNKRYFRFLKYGFQSGVLGIPMFIFILTLLGEGFEIRFIETLRNTFVYWINFPLEAFIKITSDISFLKFSISDFQESPISIITILSLYWGSLGLLIGTLFYIFLKIPSIIRLIVNSIKWGGK